MPEEGPPAARTRHKSAGQTATPQQPQPTTPAHAHEADDEAEDEDEDKGNTPTSTPQQGAIPKRRKNKGKRPQ